MKANLLFIAHKWSTAVAADVFLLIIPVDLYYVIKIRIGTTVLAVLMILRNIFFFHAALAVFMSVIFLVIE